MTFPFSAVFDFFESKYYNSDCTNMSVYVGGEIDAAVIVVASCIGSGALMC